jgi:cytoskeletal protein CcmA (bactofilin family)
MWGQDKQEVREAEGEAQPVQTTTPPDDGSGDIIAFVGKGVEFKGTISYSGTVRIDGYLDGEIHTDGVLLIGDEAVIQAKVTAGTVVCKGKITGDVAAKERVKLRAPAVFNGTMKTPVLSMEDGVLFNGGLEMSQGVRESSSSGPTLHSVGPTSQPSIKKVG